MPDEEGGRKPPQPPQPPRSSDSKKRRRRRKKTPAAVTPSKEPAKPPAGSLRGSLPPPPPAHPPQPRARLSGHDGAGQSRRRQKNSPRAPTCGSEPGARAGGNLRWEGALEDPRAEEERLEAYRADRRQRYIAHREALLRDAVKTVSANSHVEKKNTG